MSLVFVLLSGPKGKVTAIFIRIVTSVGRKVVDRVKVVMRLLNVRVYQLR